MKFDIASGVSISMFQEETSQVFLERGTWELVLDKRYLYSHGLASLHSWVISTLHWNVLVDCYFCGFNCVSVYIFLNKSKYWVIQKKRHP